MDDNIIIKITADSDLSSAQLQLRELTEESKRLEQQMNDLSIQEEKDIAQLNKMGIATESVRQGYVRERKALQDQINANEKNIASLKNSVKQYNAVNGAGQRMATQLRNMREQLMRMEEAGDDSSDAFVELSVAAAKLQDQIGDTQQRIRTLASDTLVLDAAMSAGGGVTASFNAATSAMAIFGGESEKLQEAFYKVQAALSMLNGLQEVANTLNKDSVINVALSTKINNLHAVSMAREAVAAGKATTAQKLLNIAVKANPFGIILAAISAIVAVFTIFSGRLENVGKKLRGFADGIIGFFSPAYAAARSATLAMEEYERQATRTSRTLNYQDIIHTQHLTKIEDEERRALNANKKRHASTLENYQTELKYLKQKQQETLNYTNKAIKANNAEVVAAREAMEAQKKAVSTKKGYKERQEALEELSNREKTYYDLVRSGLDLENQRKQADQAVAEMEQQIADERINMQRQVQQATIDLMNEGKEKELATLKLGYDQQIREAKGNKNLLIILEKKYQKDKANIERDYEVRSQSAYAEQLRIESENDKENYFLKESYYRADAEAKKAALDKNKMSEQEYANAVYEIESNLNQQLNALTEQQASDKTRELQRELNRVNEILNGNLRGTDRLNALNERFNAEMALYKQQEDEATLQYLNGTISYQDYQDALFEASKNRVNAEMQLESEKMQVISESFEQAMQYMQQVSDLVFEALQSNVQAQMDALEEEYTTDWEEAQKSTNKKYITEKEYEKKKAALEEKQAKYAKAQALINAAINTALAIVSTIAQLGATPWGIAASVVAGAMGAAQMGVIASKPLAQYAKGRKGGKGEYAMVGEKGAELMYIPEGASIIPHNKIGDQDAWGAYGVPRLSVPDLPSTNSEYMSYADPRTTLSIDYDKLGEAVARNIPTSKTVNVSIDKNGISIADGGSTRTYLNKKYNASWI